MSAIDTVFVNGTQLVVKRAGQSDTETAIILAIETQNDSEVIYVDRLMHEPSEKKIGNYEVSGAISTIFKLSK